jgi:hypothetical protein
MKGIKSTDASIVAAKTSVIRTISRTLLQQPTFCLDLSRAYTWLHSSTSLTAITARSGISTLSTCTTNVGADVGSGMAGILANEEQVVVVATAEVEADAVDPPVCRLMALMSQTPRKISLRISVSDMDLRYVTQQQTHTRRGSGRTGGCNGDRNSDGQQVIVMFPPSL